MMNDGGFMGFGGGFMWIFWILLIVVAIALVRGMGSGSDTQSGANRRTPLPILEERYAKGEIDEQEFEQRKRKLEN